MFQCAASFFKKICLKPLPEIDVHTALCVFVYSWLCWVFTAACGLSSLVAESRGHSGVAMLGLRTAVASLVAEPRLQAHGLQ